MARILTGIQSTGTPHLGNILGAIMPAIEMANNPKNDSFLFVSHQNKKNFLCCKQQFNDRCIQSTADKPAVLAITESRAYFSISKRLLHV